MPRLVASKVAAMVRLGLISQAWRIDEDSPDGVCPVNGFPDALSVLSFLSFSSRQSHKWRGSDGEIPARYQRQASLGHCVPYRYVCYLLCGKNVEYRVWNEVTHNAGPCNVHARTRIRTCRIGVQRRRMDALRRACKSIITGNKTPRITVSIFINGDLPAPVLRLRINPLHSLPDWSRTHTRDLQPLIYMYVHAS